MALLKSQREKSLLNRYSSFASVEKTLEDVVKLCMGNERLKRLLYYPTPHALAMPKLTQEQTYSLLGTSIKIVPKLQVEPDTKPYIIISLDQFMPQPNQTTFRTITLSFDILAAYEHWQLDDFKLRPYSIAGEIDAMVNNSFISTGIADFAGAKQLVLNEYLGGLSLYYIIETFSDDTQLQPEEK